jgi:hypothetical protein
MSLTMFSRSLSRSLRLSSSASSTTAAAPNNSKRFYFTDELGSNIGTEVDKNDQGYQVRPRHALMMRVPYVYDYDCPVM